MSKDKITTNLISNYKVVCPKHGEHEYVISSSIPGHEGAWCQLCWLESMGPSLPYKTIKNDFLAMNQTTCAPDPSWKKLPKQEPKE